MGLERSIRLILILLSSLLPEIAAAALPVYLPEDEFLLPPLLYRVETQSGSPDDGFNVENLNKKKRRTVKGEWLRFGDKLDLPGRVAIEVIQKENLKWIGGGVFNARVGTSLMAKNDLTYTLSLNRGWIRVWIKPEKLAAKIQIKTAHGTFEASDAEFWLSSRPSQTELYLIQGEVKRLGNDIPFINRTYAIFENGKERPRYLAKSWDHQAIEVTLSSSYPSLGKLVVKAEDEWKSGRSAHIYADYRKKGWKKADPLLAPDSK